jgi:lipopolysaccharide transport system ATP-binding protein
MSSEIAIKVENLSKCYQMYEAPRDRLKQFVLPRLSRFAGRQPQQYFREFWALKDISFEVKKGETVGIIGRNGSGKSTLLQVICGTLNPTGGSIQTTGRIAALLELGSGFNPEFSGRENVYLNASVLGLSTEEIDARFEDIAAFADIGEFIEQPVKTYSSGMMVRLAFAVAINVDPEILIVDEALSVGDELFQRKCFSRIEAIRASGATILFVSHSGGTIVELCDRAVLLDAGEKLAVGEPKQIVGLYQKMLYAPADKRKEIRAQIRRLDDQNATYAIYIEGSRQEQREPSNLAQRLEESYDPNLKPSSTLEYESRGASIDALQLLTITGELVNGLVRGRKYLYRYKVAFDQSATNVRFGMLVKTTSGLALGGAYSAPTLGEAIPLVEAGKSVSVEFLFNCCLNPGVYFLNAGVLGFREREEIFLHRQIDAIAFRVLPLNANTATEFIDFSVESTLSIDE